MNVSRKYSDIEAAIDDADGLLLSSGTRDKRTHFSHLELTGAVQPVLSMTF